MTAHETRGALEKYFFDRFFDRDGHSDIQNEKEGLVHRLALVATPGITLPLLMQMFGATLSAGSGLRYFLVCYSMVVTGVVMASRWDRLLPDRLDYRILTPLPLRVRDLFLARARALAKFVSLYVVAVNAAPLLMAMAFSMSAWSTAGAAIAGRLLMAHVLATVGGSVFMVLAFAALHGFLINLLGPATFERVSPRIQATATAVLAGTFLLFPLVAASIATLAENNSRLFDLFPMAWFTAVYEVVSQAPAPEAAWERWAWTGLAATGIAGVTAGATYALGYRRHSRRMIESLDATVHPTGIVESVWMGLLTRTILKNVYERAVFQFIGKVAQRSARHRMWVAAYTGGGIALALSSLFVLETGSNSAFPFLLSERGVLEAPLIVSFLLVCGSRVAFRIPYEWKARWIFEFTEASADDFVRATRKWILLTRIAPLYVVILVFELSLFDPSTAIRQVLFDVSVTMLLVEVCFFDFRVVPHTSPRPVRKLELAIYGLIYWFAFSFFVALAVAFQQRVVTGIPATLVFLGIVLATGWTLGGYRRRHPTASFLDFRLDAELQELKLT